ncbi:MAG: class I SAM-dependent methyltransferase [Tunicatimonas sp.]
MSTEDNPTSINYYVKRYLLKNQERLRNKRVLDFPAGRGVTSQILKEIGATPLPFDLFPEFFAVDDLACKKADIQEGIPLDDKAVDYVICQEGIEHFSDQLGAFREFSRVLTTGGSLLITTPNYSSIRARLSYFLSESERYNKIMPPNELDSVWFSNDDQSEEFYFGHIFLVGIQKLRVLARLSGFEIAEIEFTRARPTSSILLVLFYPFILLSNWMNYRRNLKRNKEHARDHRKKVYWEIFKLGTNVKLLVDGHLFVRFEKKLDVQQVKSDLRSKTSDYKGAQRYQKGW